MALAASGYVATGGLKVHPALCKLVEEVVTPGTGFNADYFWHCLQSLTSEFTGKIRQCLRERDELQAKVDAYHEARRAAGADLTSQPEVAAAKDFLTEIGYIARSEGNLTVLTQFTDPEIAETPAPQLVVPVDNARYVLNAINARWGSLYDALYGFDVVPSTGLLGQSGAFGTYNPLRGQAVVEFGNNLLDELVPLQKGSWKEVSRLWPHNVGSREELLILLQTGGVTGLRTPSHFVGSSGNLGPPSEANLGPVKAARAATPRVPDEGRVFLQHNQLHIVIEIDRSHPIGASSLSGIKDITLESALSVILDMEDSVSAVDAEDKVGVYRNVVGVLRGTLEQPFFKDGKAILRKLNPDITLRDKHGHVKQLSGRAVAMVRNVGHHMFTDAVLTESGEEVPEGILDLLMTVASSLHDLRSLSRHPNSREGSIYIVKPKMHGPKEVALTGDMFRRVEEVFGLQRDTVKIGIMDEERRTSVNLRECMRAVASRVFFINTGFLDRTGDEIHTAMRAGPIVTKKAMRQQLWIKTYEDSNVDIGLMGGLPGKGQIGKGMWAKPDSMKAMLEMKISEPMAGASTAWVPSPTAATLHAIHYHRVDVRGKQLNIVLREPAQIENMVTPPLLTSPLAKEEIQAELRESAQSILGYVVRWVDMGIGCSKVPDLSNVGLMEDRATLRISSQLLGNWLLHGLISEVELRSAFEEMAVVVDAQNVRERGYRPMAPNFDSVAYRAALALCLEGAKTPNGYTEEILHAARRKAKQSVLVLPSSL